MRRTPTIVIKAPTSGSLTSSLSLDTNSSEKKLKSSEPPKDDTPKLKDHKDQGAVIIFELLKMTFFSSHFR